jgi:tRNA nucleotidyltransferase (CCA-adding enzyme)
VKWTFLLEEEPAIAALVSALSPQTWPFSLEWLPKSAYLVGGSVRDALLGRRGDYLDLDFVLPSEAVETARAIARHYQAGFVVLDAERQIARVVFDQGTADFALQVGESLESDLYRRDFTINAIAYNPHTDQLVDPLQGMADLNQHLIRMVSAENLAEDPLRLLRAYRQASQLGFTVEATTRTMICEFSGLLQRIAAERVQSELNYLLSTAQGTPWLAVAWEDYLLQTWLPHATAQSLEWIQAIDQVAKTFQTLRPDFWSLLTSHSHTDSARAACASPEIKASGSARNWLITAKLACLLPVDLVAAEACLRRLKYSRNETQAVLTVLRCLPQLQAAWKPKSNLTNGSDSLCWPVREQFGFFQEIGATFPAIAVLAIARGIPETALLPLIDRVLDPTDAIAHPVPLVSGQDLMQALNIPAGPQIGQLLAAIQLARAEGTIATATDALHLAAQLIGQLG